MSSLVARPLLSVICPVFNEEKCVALFHERLMTALAPLDGIDVEIIFMNNRSTDRTADEVLALRGRDPRVQLVTLSRNVGYQASVQAGLRQACGDLLVVIDVDCEDPPEMIPRFVAGWRDGHDVVYGERKNRPEPGWLIGARKVFYRLMKLVADSDIILDMAEFCLITSEVRDAVLAHRSTFPFVRSEIAAAGFSRLAIPYDRGVRVAGETHYNLARMTTFAVAGILSSTTLPLRASVYALALVLPLNLFWLVWHVLGHGGFFDVIVVVDLCYLVTFIAFISLYIARTYRNEIARPTAVVDWRRSATNATRGASGNRLAARGSRRPPSTTT
jgi:dolichol-phosphate mannosyltransferase